MTARPSQKGPHARGTQQEKVSFPQTTPLVSPANRDDPYYGHGEVARLCDLFIRHLFQCPDVPGSANPPQPPVVHTLAKFIAYALHRTRLPGSVTFSALFLLSRLKGRFPGARGSSGHRLWISAFMIASKVVCDDTYSNKSWAIVGQHMFTLKEINQMEREMCGYLEWLLNVDPAELRAFEAAVREQFGSRSAAARNLDDLPSPLSADSASSGYSFPTTPVLYGDYNNGTYASMDPGSPYHSTGNSPATSTLATPPTIEAYPQPDGKGWKFSENFTDPRYLYVYAQHTAW